MTAFDPFADIPEKDRAAALFLGRAHRALVAGYRECKHATPGLNQRVVAERAGVDKAMVSRLLSGGGNPTLRTLAELAWAIGLEPELRFKPIRDCSANHSATSASQQSTVPPTAEARWFQAETARP